MSRVNKKSRRSFLVASLGGIGALAIGHACQPMFNARAGGKTSGCKKKIPIGPLQSANPDGIRIPKGFSSRIVAISGESLHSVHGNNIDYVWHRYPDGGATFATPDDGWIYVSNSETSSAKGGGVSAMRFAKNGEVIDAYRILGDTNNNCAGGSTLWSTWLSCEEIPFGRVWECDIYGKNPAQVHDALGWFRHEAVAIDTMHNHIYLTEDEKEGRLYRFVPNKQTPAKQINLHTGQLQVAVVDSKGSVEWATIPVPNPSSKLDSKDLPTRVQISESAAFNGGEGIWFHDGFIYFTTKGDNRVWSLNTATQKIEVIYDAASFENPVLSGVDNITVSPQGNILVAEDGGDMQIVVLDKNREAIPLLQIDGQDESEIAGPAFDPSFNRLYFSSQRGSLSDSQGLGITYEISGPFTSCFGF